MKPIIALATLIAAGIAGYLYVWPAYGQMEVVAEELAEYDRALEKIEEFKSLRDTYVSEYNSLPDEQVRRMETLLPNETNELQLLMNIDVFAGEFGIDVTEIEIAEPPRNSAAAEQNDRTVKPTRVVVRFEDDYETLAAFLEGLESRLRLLDVVAIDIDTTRSFRGGDGYSYTLTLLTYALQ
ncbi:MAG: hypothetical protein WD049_02205 [Candidatus Paceibacterota bacterium]